MGKCPKCGISNIDSAAICDCGYVLKKDTSVAKCPSCGGSNYPEARICRCCGRSVLYSKLADGEIKDVGSSSKGDKTDKGHVREGTQEREHLAGRLDYAVITDEIVLKAPGSEKKIRKGKCSKCGEFTAIGKERVLSYFLGMSSRFFCENCGRFIRGNPVKSSIAGLLETAIAILVVFFLTTRFDVQGRSSFFSLIFLVLVVGAYDGCKRMIFSVAGIARSYSKAKQKPA